MRKPDFDQRFIAMKFFVGPLTIIVLAVSSCYHQPDVIEPEPELDIPFGSYGFDYLPADSGNYWVYDVYCIDTNGQRTLWREQDSIWFSGDSILNGVTYKCFRNSGPTGNGRAALYRDSFGYVVDEKGNVRFSPVNFTDTFYRPIVVVGADTLIMEKGIMKATNKPLRTPAGDFPVVDFEVTISILDPNDPVAHLFPRKAHHRYAKGIGMVSRTYFYLSTSGNTYETVLRKYHVTRS